VRLPTSNADMRARPKAHDIQDTRRRCRKGRRGDDRASAGHVASDGSGRTTSTRRGYRPAQKTAAGSQAVGVSRRHLRADSGSRNAPRDVTFGTLSEEFADTIMGKIISGLRPNPYDVLAEATLNAAIATVASLKPESEIEALLAVQAVIAGFSALRMMELSQRHLGEENIAVYGGYANRLIRLQNELLQNLDRRRRGNSQSIVVKHVQYPPRRPGGGRNWEPG
jgi:hypothetical protein